MAGRLYIGIGGWTYEPWRGIFYPEDLSKKRELEFASRAVTSIEINGTYYSTFKPESWIKWREETPPGFVFSVKASRFCTNRKELAGGGESVERFLQQGLTELGDKLGPINWQFAGTKKFDPVDFAAFLKFLPRKLGKLALRHALEVSHESFRTDQFFELARKHNAAIVLREEEGEEAFDERTADFAYARLSRSTEAHDTGYSPAGLDAWTKKAKAWTKQGDAFVYFIAGAKERAPAGAQALIARTK